MLKLAISLLCLLVVGAFLDGGLEGLAAFAPP